MDDKKRVFVLGCILRRIGNFDMTSFDGRLTLQKTVYLMQALGLFLGYHFHWYLRGPYSPDLTRDGFALEGMFDKLPKAQFKDYENELKFKVFLRFVSKYKRNPIMLEILASIHFLVVVYSSQEKTYVFNEVMRKNASITLDDCEEVWKHLRQHGLIGG